MAYIRANLLNADAAGMYRGRFGMGGAINQKAYTVAASQTIYTGDILAKTSGANTVEQSITAPSAGSATASGGNLPILGLALNPITTNASGVETATGATTVNVLVLDPGVEIALRIYNATGSNAELQDLTLFTAYQFVRYTPTSGNPFYALSTTTTNGEFIYVEPYAGSALADDYGVAWCRLNLSETIQQG